jgi:nucleoside-diphosphate-sugar epimerase
MKVFMIGGTGLLGSEAAFELIRRGHEVSTLALPPIPSGAQLPQEMDIEFGNFMEMSDDEIRTRMEGCGGFVFAAGIDERVEGPPPVYDMFKRFNIDALGRLLRISKEVKVKHAVICGSYFSHFARTMPEEDFTRWHPYIRSRVDQEDLCLSFAGDDFNVAVLEIPYVFGTQPGRQPVWLFLVEQLKRMEKATLYPKGGTAMVTAKQIGQAVAGALERNKGGHCYPLGYYNMTWVEMLNIIHRYMGVPGKKIKLIPRWMYELGGRQTMKLHKKMGHEGGLHPVKFSKIMCSNTFIDKESGCEPLGVLVDDIDAAIGDSIKLCMEILDGRALTIGMKTG